MVAKQETEFRLSSGAASIASRDPLSRAILRRHAVPGSSARWSRSRAGEPTMTATISVREFTPDAETAIRLFRKYFFSRTDFVAFKPSWDSAACPAVGDSSSAGEIH